MKTAFDEVYWVERVKIPDWYLELAKYLHKARKKLGKDSQEAKDLARQVRLFFENQLLEGAVALGESGKDFDAEREPIDKVVIHHTSDQPGYRLSYMNAVQLLNLYVSYYANPTKEDSGIKGSPIWSGHFHGTKQVFYAYHWLMRTDGSFERLLEDDEIGWQAGNWDVNTRSVAICLDNDFENQDPGEELLKKLASHIRQHYPQVQLSDIIGHCEVREDTICPGVNFINGWKPKLISYLKNES